MKLKRDTKLGVEFICHFKTGIRNLTVFKSLKSFPFNGLLFSKVYTAWAKKVQRRYLSWSWSGIQNLEQNWLVVSKLASEIWQILTWALKSLESFHFNGLLFSKVYIVWAKKYRGVIFHETEEGYNIWRGIDLSFKNWHKEFGKFWPELSKVSKIFTLMGSLWAKYILFELKSTEEESFMKRKSDTKFGEESTHRFKIGIRNLTNCDPSARKSQKFSLNGLLLSKVYTVWAKKVQRVNLSWNWRGIQNLEWNRLVVSKLASEI